MALEFTLSPRPSRGDYNAAQARYNASEKGQARRRQYRHANSKWETDVKYLSREFIAWDGEGISKPDGSHIYVMIGNSKGGYIADPQGLHTRDIFRFLLAEYAKYRDAWHIIYGGSYDSNMWLSNAPKAVVEGIYTHDYYRWGRTTIQWRRGKSFYLRLDAETKAYEKGVTVYDVVSFFQCKFTKACEDYLGPDYPYRAEIEANKALRSTFSRKDIPAMKQYMMHEVELLVLLMVELRARLNAVTLRPRRWDGPGAIAAALLSREGVKDAMAECPTGVQEAARYAYAGGRFEPVQYGISLERAYEYDVNSAYPYALQSVPNLRRGTWCEEGASDLQELSDFALYHVRFQGADYRLPMPLFWRSYKGNIVYPGDKGFHGWYWGPDVRAAVEYVERYGGQISCDRSYRFVEDNADDRPFAFIPELYAQRQALKAAGDGAHIGIKLGLNSLYGKLAQQVGARRDPETGLLVKPPFHQLEWAGYVTSVCRSAVYRAAIDDLSSVVAYETDALFTTRELGVRIGTGLGEWEQTVFRDLTYVQSGLYFGTAWDPKTESWKQVSKTRGVNLGTLTREMVEASMLAPNAEDRTATAPLTQFITAGLALNGQWGRWRRWIVTEKTIQLEPQGKRVSLGTGAPEPGRFSRTFAARVPPSHSAQFPIAWVNPDPNMDRLDELRTNATPEHVTLNEGYD